MCAPALGPRLAQTSFARELALLAGPSSQCGPIQPQPQRPAHQKVSGTLLDSTDEAVAHRAGNPGGHALTSSARALFDLALLSTLALPGPASSFCGMFPQAASDVITSEMTGTAGPPPDIQTTPDPASPPPAQVSARCVLPAPRLSLSHWHSHCSRPSQCCVRHGRQSPRKCVIPSYVLCVRAGRRARVSPCGGSVRLACRRR